MARTKWKKPEGDNFIEDMRRAAQGAAKKTEERKLDTIADENGIFAKKIPLELLEDAPNSWNVFRDVRKDAELFEEMRKSILNVGLLQPIIVWEKEDREGYHILLGHSRKRVFEYLYKQEGIEEYGEIYAFIRPYESLNKSQAIGIITDSNIQRDGLTESESVLVLGLSIERYEEEAQRIFMESPGKYERIRDVIGEMIGRKDGKDVDNIRALCSLPREVLELVDTTPITKTHLLNPIIRDDEAMQHTLLVYKNNITKDVISMIRPDVQKDELERALIEGIIKPEPDTITITVPNGEGEALVAAFELFLENEGFNRRDFKVRLKKKRKKTTN